MAAGSRGYGFARCWRFHLESARARHGARNSPADGVVGAPTPALASSAQVTELIPLTAVSEPIASPVARVQHRSLSALRPAVSASKPQENQRAASQEAALVAAPKPEHPESLRASELPKPKRDAPVLCPDSNLFTRPMCIYQECQKPEYKNLPVCIEDRKRWEERDKQTRP